MNEEDLKRLIKRCDECKLNECINCEISYSDIQTIKRLIQEYKDLKEIEEENKFLRNQELGYIAGYEDGKKHKMTAVAMRCENMKYELYEEHIKALKKRIEDLLSIEEHRKENYIPVSLIEKKIEELNKLITEAQKELGSASKEYTIYVYQKDILQELLEKRK